MIFGKNDYLETEKTFFDMPGGEIIFGIMAGIGLAAATGFRIFLPLFALSMAAHSGFISLNEGFAWVGSTVALVILGVATVVEILAYLVPWVDHLLDVVAVPLAGIAGTLVVASTLTGTDPAVTWALALIAGGGTATAVQTSTSAARAVSTATTGGAGNPFFSAGESFMSAVFSILAFALPVLGIVLLAVVGWISYKVIKKVRN